MKPWLKEQWCIPSVGSEFVWRMEDLLDLYEEAYDPRFPTVCFDELPYQLTDEMRLPLPAEPGKPQRYDYEYHRRGTCNLFLHVEPQRGWRHVDVTERRTSQDFAHQMKALTDVHYPEATKIRVVVDNLNTHTPSALYEIRLDLLPGGGTADPAPDRVPLHPEARQLAEHGGDRALRP